MRAAVAGEMVGNIACVKCAMYRTRLGREKTDRNNRVLFCKNAAKSNGCSGHTTLTEVAPTTTPELQDDPAGGPTATEKADPDRPRSLTVLAWARFSVMLHMGLVRDDRSAEFRAIDTETMD